GTVRLRRTESFSQPGVQGDAITGEKPGVHENDVVTEGRSQFSRGLLRALNGVADDQSASTDADRIAEQPSQAIEIISGNLDRDGCRSSERPARSAHADTGDVCGHGRIRRIAVGYRLGLALGLLGLARSGAPIRSPSRCSRAH